MVVVVDVLIVAVVAAGAGSGTTNCRAPTRSKCVTGWEEGWAEHRVTQAALTQVLCLPLPLPEAAVTLSTLTPHAAPCPPPPRATCLEG